jgi:hypothetical protein
MNKYAEIYEDYRKKVEHKEPCKIIKTYADIREFIKNSKQIAFQCKTHGSGRFIGLYELNSTKEVFEVWVSEFSGDYERMVIWKDKASWDNHREAMPINIYFEW